MATKMFQIQALIKLCVPKYIDSGPVIFDLYFLESVLEISKPLNTKA